MNPESSTNNQTINEDKFGKDSIILIRLNELSTSPKTNDVVIGNDCKVVKEYLIKTKKEVFDSIYNTGKEAYKQLKDNILFEYFMGGFSNADIQKSFKELFNKYVQSNGFPYLVGSTPYQSYSVVAPNYYEFVNECITIYMTEELRKWIIKIQQYQSKDSNSSSMTTLPTKKLRPLFDMFKSRLQPSLINSTNSLINDGLNNNEVLNILDNGLPEDNTNKELTPKEINYRNKFLKVLQRTLIYNIISTINGSYREQYIVTRQFPIYNEASEQYRLYTMANSLVGIAYDYLLFNLTTTKQSYEKRICEMPNCNNEFEKTSKSNFCNAHSQEEIRKYINHKYYMLHKNQSQPKKRIHNKHKTQSKEPVHN